MAAYTILLGKFDELKKVLAYYFVLVTNQLHYLQAFSF